MVQPFVRIVVDHCYQSKLRVYQPAAPLSPAGGATKSLDSEAYGSPSPSSIESIERDFVGRNAALVVLLLKIHPEQSSDELFSTPEPVSLRWRSPTEPHSLFRTVSCVVLGRRTAFRRKGRGLNEYSAQSHPDYSARCAQRSHARVPYDVARILSVLLRLVRHPPWPSLAAPVFPRVMKRMLGAAPPKPSHRRMEPVDAPP